MKPKHQRWIHGFVLVLRPAVFWSRMTPSIAALRYGAFWIASGGVARQEQKSVPRRSRKLWKMQSKNRIMSCSVERYAGFPGRLMPQDKTPVAVFDLDGTVLSINSFPAWVRYL